MINIEIFKKEALYDNGFVYSAMIYISGVFLKEIGGFSAHKDLLEVITKDSEVWG